jgi:hypothetical protein
MGATRSERGDIRLVREEYTRLHSFVTLPFRGSRWQSGSVDASSEIIFTYEKSIVRSLPIGHFANEFRLSPSEKTVSRKSAKGTKKMFLFI